ncbi:hypothetical protein F3Y22_tig00116997pilonHSYRG00980 [Hibiscus syriacus]|uniref:BZIP domain-containing protein n=1 Tax=Hibiscus syriacus TaxID=106335 RepID=A0A6A2XKW8_HIBSY|nr:hypothetical protein F3Y22_tig00116997pilonHSYRG00980 [Hibiscus syriacus]
MPQRQQTLGEITLEEFLVRAGVVREDTQLAGKVNNGGFFGLNNTSFEIGFQQGPNLIGNRIPEGGNHIGIQASNLPSNVKGVRSNQHQLAQQQQQPIFPKQTGVSSDGIGKNSEDTSSVSPVPYVFNGNFRGRKYSGVEKVAERRQRRKIKNRESAARSRARKQAYTMELEAVVANLKEENQELRKKLVCSASSSFVHHITYRWLMANRCLQSHCLYFWLLQAELMEMQKKEVIETMKTPQGAKKRCLPRTQTGPW